VRVGLTSLWTLAILVCAADAFPQGIPSDAKRACANAAEDGQRAMAAGSLIEARRSFRLCARDSCPSLVRDDCAGWLEKAELSIPTITVRAYDPSGADVDHATVTVDGEVVADHLDGRAYELNPGDHVVSVTYATSPPVTQHVRLGPAEKRREVSVHFVRAVEARAAEAAPAPSPVPQPSPSPEEHVASSHNARPVGLVFGGVGLALLGLAAYFQGSAISDYNSSLQLTGDSMHRAYQQASNQQTYAEVSLGVGLAALGTGAFLFFLSTGPAKPQSASTGVYVSAGASRSALTVRVGW
jgi:hypothetical protein